LQGTVPDEALRIVMRGADKEDGGCTPEKEERANAGLSGRRAPRQIHREIRDNQVKLIMAVLNCFLVEKLH
jgi:hypothetical protein